jgi:cytochrome b
MRNNLVYELPTRLFHWLFAGFFLFSFIVAKTIDDDSIVFSYHMLSGLMLGGLIIWRVFWGLFGSQHAKFSGFNLHPLELKNYFLGIISGSKKRWAGHNPASSWATLAMLALGLGLAVTGYLMSTGNKEAFEDIHEFLAHSFIVVVIAHVAGIILHSIRYRDGIGFSMIDGKKAEISASESIPSNRPWAALLLLLLVTSGSLYLFKNFNSTTRTLPVFGQTLQLGENETEEGKGENVVDDDGDDD